MSTVAVMQSVTPLIPTGGALADALSFYVEKLGFAVAWENGGSAGIGRDNISLMLVTNSNREWADNAVFSIGVTDLDSLFQEYQGSGTRMSALETKPWGRREFSMIAPSGVCFYFFQQD